MAKTPALTRREREIMDILYRLGRASAQEVLDNLDSPPSYSAVRALLRLLEERGHAKHVKEDCSCRPMDSQRTHSRHSRRSREAS